MIKGGSSSAGRPHCFAVYPLTSFSKISGISLKTTEYTAINEGGRDIPYILLDQSKNFNTITFERY